MGLAVGAGVEVAGAVVGDGVGLEVGEAVAVGEGVAAGVAVALGVAAGVGEGVAVDVEVGAAGAATVVEAVPVAVAVGASLGLTSRSLAVEPLHAVNATASSGSTAMPAERASAVWRLMSRPSRASPDDDNG